MAEDKAAVAMRKLSQEAREEAIDASDNVQGYERFLERSKQVTLQNSYKRPQGPPKGGKA